MDGRKVFHSGNLPFLKNFSQRFAGGVWLLAVVAALWAPGAAFGQAMGKVALDPPAAAPATAPAAAPGATVPVIPPALAPPVASRAEIKPVVPLPATSAAATTLPATVGKKPETPVKSQLVTEKPGGDSMPADPTQAIVPVRPIEQKEIRPHTGQVASGTQPGSTTEGLSASPGIWSALQVAAALAIVIGLIFIGKGLARRFLPGAKAGNGKGVIEILARYPLAKNQSLVLVRIGSQIVTLNQGRDQSHSVLVISDPNEVAKIVGQIEGTSPNSIQSGFNRLLANARMDLESSGDDEKEDFEASSMKPQNLDSQLDEMAAAKRQLMELRQQVRSVRDSLPR